MPLQVKKSWKNSVGRALHAVPLPIVVIPVMRYERAARPCALNFRLAALKCRFGRPPNALSSVGV